MAGCRCLYLTQWFLHFVAFGLLICGTNEDP